MTQLPISKPKVFLMPGQLHIARKPAIVRTILGSCLSVTFYVERFKIGSICHSLLPSRCNNRVCFKEGSTACPYGKFSQISFKYTDCSIRYMIDFFNQMGVFKEEIEVKVFGGGDVLNFKNSGQSSLTIGKSNIKIAKKIIKQENLRLKTWDVGGNYGRKLIFYPHTGDVYIKLLKST